MSNVEKYSPEDIEAALQIVASSSAWRAVTEFCELRMDQIMSQLAVEADYAMIRYYQGQIAVYRELYNTRSASE